MEFKLLASGWAGEIDQAAKQSSSSLLIVCPFIKRKTAERLFSAHVPKDIRVITRFDLNAFNAGVSDIDALELLLARGAVVRGIVGVHAKMYLFDRTRAIVTSANLTEAALFRNSEFGFSSDDPTIAAECCGYFESMWSRTKANLSLASLKAWRRKLASHRLAFPGVLPETLPDYGESGTTVSPFLEPLPRDRATQSFVKFFGRADNRASLDMSIEEEVVRSGSHWACTYPRGKRPRQVRDGAVMFMARMVQSRGDYMIYGRAIGREHRPGFDDASPSDISLRPWKENWPHYVRVHQPIFLRGPLSTGVSMIDMMAELGSAAFAATYRNAAAGEGENTDPRRAIMRKPHMELTPEAYGWISDRLERAFLRHGAVDLSKPDFDELRSHGLMHDELVDSAATESSVL